jgi:thymidine kinase
MVNINNAMYKPQLKWVLVDESQFLSKEQVDQLAAVVDKFEVSVMCYGLRTDFQTHLFEGSKRLFEVADTLIEIKSSCECDTKTIFNARVDKNGDIVTEGEQIEVGGDDRYVSMCRKCFYQKTKNPLYVRKDQ